MEKNSTPIVHQIAQVKAAKSATLSLPLAFPLPPHTSNGPHSSTLPHTCYTQDTQGAPALTKFISQDTGSVTHSVAHQHPYSLPTVYLSQSLTGLCLLSQHSTTTNKHPQLLLPFPFIPQQTSHIHTASTFNTQTRQCHHSLLIPLQSNLAPPHHLHQQTILPHCFIWSYPIHISLLSITLFRAQ